MAVEDKSTNTPSDEFSDDTSTNTPASSQESGTKTFEQQVNDVVGKMVEKDGKWVLPEDIEASEEVKYAAKLEKRYRDTQGAYTKSRQKLKEVETINDKLTKHLIDSSTMHLNEKQKEELDELKVRDPDAWREKLNEYEGESRRILQEKIDSFRQDGKQMSELEMRQAQLEAFTESTGIELNDEIIENELPASYSKQLADGKITFDQFLEKAQEFLSKDKVIKGSKDNPKPNTSLDKLPGGHRPSASAEKGDIVATYKNEVY